MFHYIFYYLLIICLQTVVWFQVLLSNTNNLCIIILYKLFLFDHDQFGLVLWHINNCWLFKAKSCF